jgi:hypothetical protein
MGTLRGSIPAASTFHAAAPNSIGIVAQSAPVENIEDPFSSAEDRACKNPTYARGREEAPSDGAFP